MIMEKKPRCNKIYLLSCLLLFLVCMGEPVFIQAQSDYKLAEQDSLALLAFYWATDGPNWTSNQPGFGFSDLSSEWQGVYDGQFNAWLDGPAKDWFGVRVEKRPIENSVDSAYRVTWLWPVIGRRTDGQNQLDGYVPREVGLLTALNQFRVNGNDGFTWEILPDEIYHPSLQWLDVESCWFGEGVSEALRNCTDIRKMNLRYNNFDYIPNWDFLDEQALRNLNGTQWLYNSRFSFALLERIINHFYSISPNLQEFGIEMRDMFDVGDEQEIVAPLGTSVDMVCNDAGEQSAFITYQWFKDGLSRFGRTQKTYSISSVSAADYGDYTVRITNDYVKTYDLNTNYGEVFTKKIHLVAQPVPPVIEKAVSAYSGQYIELYFSKPMTDTTLAAYQNLTLTADNNLVSIISAEIFGRIDKKVRIYLASPVNNSQNLELSFSGSGNIADKNGGLLQAFSSLQIENRVRVAPEITGAATTLDGSGIEVYFDGFIDEASLVAANFKVSGDTTHEISTVTLAPGEIDAHISKTVLLSLKNPLLDTTEVLSVEYVTGQIHGLYGGTVEMGDSTDVLNIISVERRTTTLIFEDGSESLGNVVIKGSWQLDPISMYDDGTNTDATADDHIWTYTTQFVKNDYTWDVYERKEITAYDTVETVDPNTGVVTLTITPFTVNQDSLLSEKILLAISVTDSSITGDTLYGIQNRAVIFHLTTSNANEDVFLMGINGDWQDGRLMSTVNAGSLYADTLIKMTAGDEIEYNYRIGNDWENQTPDPRSYTVKNGDNLIRDQFGLFTGIDEKLPSPVSIYPNPSAEGKITIAGLQNISRMDVYNSGGQRIHTWILRGQDLIIADFSDQANGLYFLKVVDGEGKLSVYKILLQ